jgi:hypothetical protein
MEMNKKREVIKTKDDAGNDIELAVLYPTHRIVEIGQMAYRVKMSELMRLGDGNGNKLLSRLQLAKYLAEHGIWTAEDENSFTQVQLNLRDMELRLKTGGISREDGRKLASTMKGLRATLLALHYKKSQHDELTMEFIAEQHKFKTMLVESAVHADTGNKYFLGIEDYEERQDQQAVIDLAKTFSTIVFGYDANTFRNLPENQWLKNFGFMNDDGQYIDKTGHQVDTQGRKIDDLGRFIDNEGNFIDAFGNRVDEQGNFIVENPQPFYDENGEPILSDGSVEKKSKPKKRRAKKKG